MARSPDLGSDLLIFHCSGHTCALSLKDIKEVVPMAQLLTPPGMPSLLAGFLDLGGTAIPVLRFDRLFPELPPQPPGLHTPILVVAGGPGDRLGILVGGVERIIDSTTLPCHPMPEKQIFRDCAASSADWEGRAVHVLSLERIFLEKERRTIAEFEATELARSRDLVGGGR